MDVRVLLTLLLLFTGINSRGKTFRIYKFEGVCEGYENISVILENIHMVMMNRVHLISLKVQVKEDVNEDVKMNLELIRCKSREALDTCEKYQTVRVKNTCSILSAEGKPWTPVFSKLQPKFPCPFRKGTYTLANGTFDATPLTYLPISGWYWIAKTFITGQETGNLYSCTVFESQLVSL